MASIWSILDNVPYALEKNIYYAVVGWSPLLVSVRSSWLLVLFKFYTSLLVFSLVVPSVIESELLKFQLLLLIVSPFISVSFVSCIFVLCY